MRKTICGVMAVIMIFINYYIVQAFDLGYIGVKTAIVGIAAAMFGLGVSLFGAEAFIFQQGGKTDEKKKTH